MNLKLYVVLDFPIFASEFKAASDSDSDFFADFSARNFAIKPCAVYKRWQDSGC